MLCSLQYVRDSGSFCYVLGVVVVFPVMASNHDPRWQHVCTRQQDGGRNEYESKRCAFVPSLMGSFWNSSLDTYTCIPFARI